MAQKPNIRPIQGQQRPLTEEEKKFQVMRFLQQKREQFTLTILNGLCHNIKSNTPDAGVIEGVYDVVDLAVKMADKLMEKLYPIKEEESK